MQTYLTSKGFTLGGEKSRRWLLALFGFCAVGCGDTATNTGKNRGGPSLEPKEAGAFEGPDAEVANVHSGMAPTSDNLTEFVPSGAYTSDFASGGSSEPAGSAASPASSGGVESPSPLASSVSEGISSAGNDATSAQGYTPVDDPPAGLTGCEDQSTAAETSCVYSLHCDEHQLWAGCLAIAGDRWECSCLDNATGARLNYEVSGATAEQACRETVVMCVDGEAPRLTDASCSSESLPAAANTCARKHVCVTEGALKPGLVVSERTATFTSTCEYYESGPFCRCDNWSDRFRVFELSGEDACEALDEFCSGTAAAPTERDCEAPRETVTTDTCESLRSCGLRLDLNDSGAYALVDETTVGARCEVSGGATSCECSRAAGRRLRVKPQEPTLVENCRAAREVCEIEGAVVLSGSLDCETISVFGGGVSCSLTALCRVDANVGQEPVEVLGNLNTECSSTSGGTWTCRCSSGEEHTEDFTVSGSDGVEVCGAGRDTCAQMVVGFGADYAESNFSFGPVDASTPDASTP